MNTEEIYICDCGSYCHHVIFYYDKEDKQLSLTVHLNQSNNFFKRCLTAIKYIFNYRSLYGDYDNFIFKLKDEEKLLEYLRKVK